MPRGTRRFPNRGGRRDGGTARRRDESSPPRPRSRSPASAARPSTAARSRIPSAGRSPSTARAPRAAAPRRRAEAPGRRRRRQLVREARPAGTARRRRLRRRRAVHVRLDRSCRLDRRRRRADGLVQHDRPRRRDLHGEPSITDQAGTSATDTVKIAVYDPSPTTLFNQSKNDATPGVLSNGHRRHGLDRVPVHRPRRPPADGRDRELGAAGQRLRHAARRPNGRRHRRARPVGRRSRDDRRRQSQARHVEGHPREVHDRARHGDRQGHDAGRHRIRARSVHDRPVQVPDRRDPAPRRGPSAAGPRRSRVGWDTNATACSTRAARRSRSPCPRAAPSSRSRRPTPTASSAARRRPSSSAMPTGWPARPSPITVVGVADSGINPYHFEFSAATYPDPDVLALTRNFTRHPSEYISGYPASSTALPITLGQGYYPAKDKAMWASVDVGKLYWIPGTKIIGAIDAGDSSAVERRSGQHPHRRRRRPRHGLELGLGGQPLRLLPDLPAHVHRIPRHDLQRELPVGRHHVPQLRTVGGVPLGLALGPDEDTKAAAERGQTVLFAAGNGVGNAFDVPADHLRLGRHRQRLDDHRRRHPPRQPARDRRRRHPGRDQRLGRRQPAVGLPDRHRRPVRVRWHLGRDAVHRGRSSARS